MSLPLAPRKLLILACGLLSRMMNKRRPQLVAYGSGLVDVVDHLSRLWMGTRCQTLVAAAPVLSYRQRLLL